MQKPNINGRAVLTHLFYVLIIVSIGGVLFVQYQYHLEKMAAAEDKNHEMAAQAKSLNDKIENLEKEIIDKKAEEDGRLEDYAAQLQKLSDQLLTCQSTLHSTQASLKICEESLKATQQPPSQPITPDQSPTPQQQISGFQCPAPEKINQSLEEGQWSDDNFKWWVEFSFRPLRVDEVVKDPFQVLFADGFLDCYYRIGPKEDDAEVSNTWMVIKGRPTDSNRMITLSPDWLACDVDGCSNKCEYKKPTDCQFDLSKP